MRLAKALAAKRIATIIVVWKSTFSKPRRAYRVFVVSEPKALPSPVSDRWRRIPAIRINESII